MGPQNDASRHQAQQLAMAGALSGLAQPEDITLDEDEAYDLLKSAEGLREEADDESWSIKSEASAKGDTWKDVLGAAWTSLRACAGHVDASLEALVFGWVPLLKKHEGEEDEVEGVPITDNAELLRWLHYSKWALASYAAKTPLTLSQALGIQLSDVIYHNPRPTKHRPAYFLALQREARTLNLVVRGTCHVRDLVTDLSGHCVPFFGGSAHYGMVSSARAIVAAEITRLETTLAAFPGLTLQCIGHSLGGGVAALIAYLLRNTPELASRLHGAAVTCFTLAAPPVMTYELALECAPYTTTLVHNHDMVPRTSVCSLKELSQEMLGAKEEVYGDNAVASLLRRSGGFEASRALVQRVVQHYAIAKPAAAVAGMLVKNPALKVAVGMGVQLLGKSLANTVANSASAGAAGSPRSGAAAAAAEDRSSGGASKSRALATSALLRFSDLMQDTASKLQQEAAPVAAAPATATAAAGSSSSKGAAAGGADGSGGSGLKSMFMGFREKVKAAAAEAKVNLAAAAAEKAAAVAAKAEQKAATYAVTADATSAGAPAAAAAAATVASPAKAPLARQAALAREAAPSQDDQQQEGEKSSAPPSSAQQQQQQEPHKHLPLYSPGTLYWIVGTTAPTDGTQGVVVEITAGQQQQAPAASAPPPGAAAAGGPRVLRCHGPQRFGRLLLKRSMLRDHLLGSYMSALQQVLQAGSVYPPPADDVAATAAWAGTAGDAGVLFGAEGAEEAEGDGSRA